jgi:hypothetical protein
VSTVPVGRWYVWVLYSMLSAHIEEIVRGARQHAECVGLHAVHRAAAHRVAANVGQCLESKHTCTTQPRVIRSDPIFTSQCHSRRNKRQPTQCSAVQCSAVQCSAVQCTYNRNRSGGEAGETRPRGGKGGGVYVLPARGKGGGGLRLAGAGLAVCEKSRVVACAHCGR